jgi:hypothetical protein
MFNTDELSPEVQDYIKKLEANQKAVSPPRGRRWSKDHVPAETHNVSLPVTMWERLEQVAKKQGFVWRTKNGEKPLYGQAILFLIGEKND